MLNKDAADAILQEKRLKNNINSIMIDCDTDTNDATSISTSSLTPSKEKKSSNESKRTKSPAQLTAEAALKSQEVALLTEQNTKHTLEIQKNGSYYEK